MEAETIRFVAGIIILASMLIIKINERKSSS